MAKRDREVNAKSVLSVLTLDCHQGDKIVIRAEGAEADATLARLAQLWCRAWASRHDASVELKGRAAPPASPSRRRRRSSSPVQRHLLTDRLRALRRARRQVADESAGRLAVTFPLVSSAREMDDARRLLDDVAHDEGASPERLRPRPPGYPQGRTGRAWCQPPRAACCPGHH